MTTMKAFLEFVVICASQVNQATSATLKPVPIPNAGECTPTYPLVALNATERLEIEVLKADGWFLTTFNGTEALKKEFRFESFERAFSFMTDVSFQCAFTCFFPAQWKNGDNNLEVILYSNAEVGLTKNDMALGHFMDEEELLFAPVTHKLYDNKVAKVLKKLTG